MVLLELAAGKGITTAASTAGLGFFKVLAAGVSDPSSVALASPSSHAPLVLPWADSTPGLDASPLLDLGNHVGSFLSSGATAAYNFLDQACVGIGAASAGTCAIFRYYGFCEDLGQKDGEQEDEEHSSSQSCLTTVIPRAATICVFVDSFTVGALLDSLRVTLEVPLRTWALGGLLLSFPASYAIRRLTQEKGHRTAFGLEMVLSSTAFMWLALGTVLLGQHPELVNTVPTLWWTCFGQCVLSWSVISVAIAFMVLTTITTLLIS
mmetsp:Transcript_59452/g.134007  ORF Transcript_59452/g.134007 Transcript_59452/m.134007 type:complete len:265 (-) Transcript_59452:60-854(-)